jgi:hypothetical protein
MRGSDSGARINEANFILGRFGCGLVFYRIGRSGDRSGRRRGGNGVVCFGFGAFVAQYLLGVSQTHRKKTGRAGRLSRWLSRTQAKRKL